MVEFSPAHPTRETPDMSRWDMTTTTLTNPQSGSVSLVPPRLEPEAVGETINIKDTRRQIIPITASSLTRFLTYFTQSSHNMSQENETLRLFNISRHFT